MKDSPFVPARGQIFVCVNRRDATDPLGGGCGERGEAVYDALRAELARRGLRSSVWLTKTYCLGVCPRQGSCVALGRRLFTEVTPDDVPGLLTKLPT